MCVLSNYKLAQVCNAEHMTVTLSVHVRCRGLLDYDTMSIAINDDDMVMTKIIATL